MADNTASGAGDTSASHSLVFSAPGPLTPEALTQLQAKFGLQLRSSSAAVSSQMSKVAEEGVVFFDKSNPGFDKTFDKTSPDLGGVDVINPADLHARLSVLENHVAQLKTAAPQAKTGG
jgi:hypothetical protein